MEQRFGNEPSARGPLSPSPSPLGAGGGAGQASVGSAPGPAVGQGAGGADKPGGFGADLGEYLRILRRRWPFAFLVCLLVSGGVFLWTYRQPKVYQAATTLVIDPRAPQVLQGVKEVVELGTGTFWAAREFYKTQYLIIKSKPVARRVVAQLGAHFSDEVDAEGKPLDEDALAAMVLGQVKVAPVKESRAAQIQVTDLDPKRAALVANAFAEAYIAHNLDRKLEGTRSAETFLGDQVVNLSQRLTDTENDLFQYRKKKKLLALSLDDKLSITSKNIQDLNARITALKAQRVELEAQIDIIDATKTLEEQETIPQVRASTVVSGLRKQLLDTNGKLVELQERYGEKHPKVANLSAALRDLRREYRSEISKVKAAVHREYQAVVQQEQALTKWMNREKAAAIDFSQVENEYRPMVREFENTQRLHSMVTQRLKETGLTGLNRTNNVWIMDAAKPPTVPIKPRMVVNVAIGVMLGLLLGVLTAFGLELLDNTLKSQEDIERVAGVPAIGILPALDPKASKRAAREGLGDRDLWVYKQPQSSAAECARAIRTNLMFMSADQPLQTFVITSPGPREGKTTCAISLAIAMAQAGGKVLLADTDMRRPRIHKSFGLKNHRGISSFVVGETPLDQAIQETEVPNLDFLNCGPPPPNPADLIHTRKFHDMVEDLKSRYDKIIFDSPPTSAVTDPAILGNMADGIILVVRSHKTSRDGARHARRQLTDAKARMLGVIINEVQFSSASYGYYYAPYKYYGRYYGPDQRLARAVKRDWRSACRKSRANRGNPSVAIQEPRADIWTQKSQATCLAFLLGGRLWERSDVQKQTLWIFDALLDAHQELNSFAAIDDPVIVGQSDVHHRSNLDRVTYRHWALVDGVQAQNAALRGIENRRRHHRPVDPTI